jgi:hypothetical protein
MHGIAQVVQELANDLALVFLLDPAQDGGVGRGRRDGEAGFQVVLRSKPLRRNYRYGWGVPLTA